ncbi:MAG: SH3 domain-containing protein [Burkholderiales bacterium]|jgi:SH3-like domain-containing protein|nr:SH3 domain-containing protein [Burkholderiales bacterium]
MRAGAAFLAVSLLAFAGGASAEFRSVVEPAVAYDTPSERGKKLFVVSRGYPVDAVVTLEGWVRVRDPAGELAWLPAKALSDRRTVVVTAPAATVRERADEDAPIVFQAANGVILDYAEPGAPGWVRVRHRDGQAGFVRISQVWGG